MDWIQKKQGSDDPEGIIQHENRPFACAIPVSSQKYNKTAYHQFIIINAVNQNL